MNFGASRASAIEKLNKFVDQNLFEYSRLRNFDYGPNNRTNISFKGRILLTVQLFFGVRKAIPSQARRKTAANRRVQTMVIPRGT